MGDNRKMNPQRVAFKEYYCNPASDTFSNAYQSAKKAGFAEEYSKQILNKDNIWVLEIVKRLDLIKQAEENLKQFLIGEDEKIRADITKFVLSRLNKDVYSDRRELSGTGGKDLIPDEAVKEKVESVLDNYFKNECEKTD